LRWEIVPLKGVEDRIAHLPAGATVTITSSPAKGIDATLALCETVLESRSDCTVTPHISSRLIRDKAHLSELVHRLEGLGVVDAARLLRISVKIGIGDSVRFLAQAAGCRRGGPLRSRDQPGTEMLCGSKKE
jgi:hypothetical protein